MVKRIWTDKDFRRKAEFILTLIRTAASITAATILIISHWK